MNNALKFIKNLNINNKTIVAAISGGPDSMLLLDILLNIREKLNIKIVVAHVHHNLRIESDEEAIKVEEFCNKHDLIFEMKKIEKYPDDKFSEESARKIRYEYFDEVVKKYEAYTLFTAHHGDDLIETVLMRLTRGSSIKGYAGFECISMDRGYIIARPLIYLTKQQIVEILDNKNMWYAIDMSNDNTIYTRNRYRKTVLPELKKENKNVHLKFIEFNQKLLEVNKYIQNESNKYYNKCVLNNEIDIEIFNGLDDIIKRYILEQYLKKIYNDEITRINDKHINIIINNIKKGINISFDLPMKKGLIEYKKFKIIDYNIDEDYEYVLNDSIELPDGKRIFIDNFTKCTSNYVIHLDSKQLDLPLHVRNYKTGDNISVKNMLGTKKVSNIFIDSKIPKRFRNMWPIVTDNKGNIIWIPGIKKSKFDMKKEEKYDIILRYD